MTQPLPASKVRRSRLRRRDRLLGAFLRLIDKTGTRHLNAAFIAAIFAASLLISVSLAWVLDHLMGPGSPAGLYPIVLIIASVVPLIIAVPAVFYADAMMRRLNGTRRDLDEALAQARLASRAKSEFLANVSHEIRTPMNGVLGMVQVLDATELSDTQRESLRLIRVSGDMLMTLIDDILDLSRIEAGRIDLHLSPHRVMRPLADTVALYQARAEERGTTLRFEVADGTPDWLIYDSVRVRQCLGNLVSNAVKFTKGGSVTVTLSARGVGDGQVEVSVQVRDSGIGIDPASQKRLFEVFSQAEITTVRDYGGTGLGLAISRRLARMMGGDITVASVLGVGSTFTFRFLAQATQTATPPEEPEADPRPMRPRDLLGVSILVVDDSAVNRKVACGLLAPTGAVCLEAVGGAEALAVLAVQPVDLVLLDMQMPVMDGAATLRVLRTSGAPFADLPVIALTANAMEGERERCLAMGMQGYVSKPVRLAALLDEITTALAAGPPRGNPRP